MIEIELGSARVVLYPTTETQAVSESTPRYCYRPADALRAMEQVIGAVMPDGSGAPIIAKLKEARAEI